MQNLELSITTGIFITLIPFIIYNFREIKANKEQTILWGILSFMLGFLFMKIANEQIHYIALFITTLTSSIINYYIVDKNISIIKTDKKIPIALLVLGLYFFSSLFQLIPIALFKLDIKNLSNIESLLLSIFSNLVLTIILCSIYFKDLKSNLKALFKNLNKIIDCGVKYWLIGLLGMVISNLIINLFIKQAVAGNEQNVQQIISSTGILSVIAIGILAPIIEELTFRKAIRDLFKSDKLYILMSGLIFGSLHVVFSLNSYWDLFYIIPYSSLGIAFGYMYVKTNNIYTSIIMHIFHNTVLTLFSILGAVIILWWVEVNV